MSEHLKQWARVGWLTTLGGWRLIEGELKATDWNRKYWEWWKKGVGSHSFERGSLNDPPPIPDEAMNDLPPWMRGDSYERRL